MYARYVQTRAREGARAQPRGPSWPAPCGGRPRDRPHTRAYARWAALAPWTWTDGYAGLSHLARACTRWATRPRWDERWNDHQESRDGRTWATRRATHNGPTGASGARCRRRAVANVNVNGPRASKGGTSRQTQECPLRTWARRGLTWVAAPSQ